MYLNIPIRIENENFFNLNAIPVLTNDRYSEYLNSLKNYENISNNKEILCIGNDINQKQFISSVKNFKNFGNINLKFFEKIL